MEAQTVMAISLVIIAICNLAVLVTLVFVAMKLAKTVGDLQTKAHTAIDKVQRQVDDISAKIKPTVNNAHRALSGAADSVGSVQRSVRTGESMMKQLAAPTALAIFAARTLRLPGMVVGALGFAAGLFAKQQMDARTAAPRRSNPLIPVPTVTGAKSFNTTKTAVVDVTKRNGVTSSDNLPPILTGVVEK